jgi:Bacterial protein of unknown function (DUF916)
VAVAAGLLLSTLAAPLVGAQDAPAPSTSTPAPVTWGVHPGDAAGQAARPNFVFEGAPGDTFSDVLVVDNTSDVNLVLGVYASDAFNTPEGGTDLLSADRDPVDVGSWTTAEQASITVPAGGTVEVPFTVEIPDDAAPGDHTGGIVTSLRLEGDGDHIDIERRLGTRIYVRIDGGVEPALTFTDLDVQHHDSWNPFAAGSVTVRYTVENTGNVRLRATRIARVAGSIGPARTAEAADMPELLPGNSYELTQEVPGVWPGFGTEVEVELDPYDPTGAELDPAPVNVVARTEVTIFPVAQVLLLVVLIAVVVALLVRRRGARARREREIAEAVDAAVGAATAATVPPTPPAWANTGLADTAQSGLGEPTQT